MNSSRAVDGNYNTNTQDDSCTHTEDANNDWYEMINFIMGAINGEVICYTL